MKGDDLFSSTSVSALLAGAGETIAGMPTYIWAGGASVIGSFLLFAVMRRTVKIKFGVISVVALASGAISSASSASTMFAILDGTGVVFQTLFTGAFGALIAGGMVLSAKRQRLAALAIFIPSTLTSAAAFNTAIRYAEEGKSVSGEEMQAVRDAKGDLLKQLGTERQSIATIADQIAAEREALASAERRLSQAETALVTRAAVAVLEGEIERKRREIDELQDQMDCERVGTAAKPGCLGFGGVPVANAGTGERWTAAFKRINGDPETGTKGLKVELAELEAQRANLDASLVKTRDQASDAVGAARQSVASLIDARGKAEDRADEVQEKIDAWKPPKKSWVAIVWESLDDLVVDNELGKSLGFTMEGFKTFGGLWLAAMFDFLASLLGIEGRKRRPWRGIFGTWEAIRDWFVHGDDAVEIEGGYAADTHVITTRLGRFTGATEEEARAKAIAAERKVEEAREAAQDAKIEAKARSAREKARREAEKITAREERRNRPSIAARVASAALQAAGAAPGRALGRGARRNEAAASDGQTGGAIFDPERQAEVASRLRADVEDALGGSEPVRIEVGQISGGAPRAEDQIPSERMSQGAAGLSVQTPDAVAVSEGERTPAQSGETDPAEAGVFTPSAPGASGQDAIEESDPVGSATADGDRAEMGGPTTPLSGEDHGLDGRPVAEDAQPSGDGEAFEMDDAARRGDVHGQHGDREGVQDAAGHDGPADDDTTSEAGPSESSLEGDGPSASYDTDDAPGETSDRSPANPRDHEVTASPDDPGVSGSPTQDEDLDEPEGLTAPDAGVFDDDLEDGVAPVGGLAGQYTPDPDEDVETLDDAMERARLAMAERRKSLREANEEALERERQPRPEEPRRRARKIEDAFASDDDDIQADAGGDPEEPLVLEALDGGGSAEDVDGFEEDSAEQGLDEGFTVGGVAVEDFEIDASRIDNGSWAIGDEWAADHANRPRSELPNTIAENHDGRPAGSPSAMASLRRGQKAKEARIAERATQGRTIKGGRNG